jgi:predicted permease
MRVLRAWLSRTGDLFHKRSRDGELAAELESHLQMHIEDNLRAGMAPEEARRQALLKLGGVEQTKENYRDRRGLPWLETLLHDIRFGLRMLRKNPGFTAVAVLTLALGIGANTAIFSVVNAVLLRPLPYQNPGNLVQVWNTYLPAWPQLGLSPGDFEDFRKRTQNFTEMAAYVAVPTGFNMTGRSDPERVQAAYASSELLPMLGIRPVLGRNFAPEEDKPGNTPVMLISHDLWQTSFDSDPEAVGRTFNLDGRGYTLIGVLPADFRLVPTADVWMPVGQYADDLTGRIHHPFNVIARMKLGAAISQAQAEMETFNRQEALPFPDTHKNWGVTVRRMEDPSAARLRLALLVLLGAVALVLLIACANIMNLLLARNAARRKEIGLRIALGASRLRLARQLVTESMLLSVLGGTLGILLAAAALRALQAFVPADLETVKEASLNGWVLGFTISACFLTGIVCGLVPAHQALRVDLNSVLKEGDRLSGAPGSRKLRNLLVVSEIALALIPLVGAGLLIRSFYRLLEVSPGFRPDHALTMQVTQPAIPLDILSKMSPEEQQQLTRKQSLQFEQIGERIQNLPGVKLVGGINVLPLGSAMVSASRFLIEGQPAPAAGARPGAEVRAASLGYFATMGIPLRRGRLLDADDWTSRNIVINEFMARRFWSGSDPIGKRINLCSLAPQPCWYSIVGVVGDVHEYGLDKGQTFDVYGTGGWTPYFVIRTASDPSAITLAAIQEIHKFDPSLPVTQVATLDNLLSDSVSARRFSTVLLGIFAALALAMSAVGIYGVMSYAVSMRTNEIGIRLALGAQRSRVLGMILLDGLLLCVIGIAIGIFGAFAMTRLMKSLVFGVSPADPLTFVLVAVLLASVAFIASWIPARRAMRVDPMVALRHE